MRAVAVGLLLACFGMAGCASIPLSTAVRLSSMSPATLAQVDPSQVRVYFQAPPGGYEEIARLETQSGAFTYGEQNKMDSVVAKLREQAAKLGANGVLFQGTADGYGGSAVSVGAGGGRVGGSSFSGGGVGVSISPRQKHARGIAIHVANPPPVEQAPPAPEPQPQR